MKRIGKLWERLCSLENIKLAHCRARRGKKHYGEVMMVDKDPQKYFGLIREMLVTKTFVNSPYVVMMRNDGLKMREIWKLPYYPDRIIHHCIVNVLESMWMRGFIRDTYAALPKRGVHDGVKRIRKALGSVEETRYCLKMDVKKFYQSIDHEILKRLLRRKIKDTEVIWLLDLIIDSARGVPIGNYSSQYFANFYLSDFDHWIKEVLGVKYYFRYCDDLVFLGTSKENLHELRRKIDEYFRDKLKIDVKGNWQVFPVDSRGIDFLGYRFFHRYTLVRKSIVRNFKKKYRAGNREAMAAYNGWFVWGNTYNLRRKYAGFEFGKASSD